MGYRSILGIVSIASSLAIFASPVAADPTQIIDIAPNSQSHQDTQTKRVIFTLNTHSIQNFAGLMQKAELMATNLMRQGFAESPSIKEMSVSILGERNGQEVPLLVAKVSRSDWQRQPILQQWTKYFSSSAALLGFVKPPSKSPPSSPAPAAVRRSPRPRAQPSSTPTTPTFVQPSPSAPAPGQPSSPTAPGFGQPSPSAPGQPPSTPTAPGFGQPSPSTLPPPPGQSGNLSPSPTPTTPSTSPSSPASGTSSPGSGGASVEQDDPGYR